MALTLEVVKPLENGRVQIDAKSTISGMEVVSSFSVPESKKDEFIADYKKEKKMRTLSGVAGGLATVAMSVAGLAASKKANAFLRLASTALFTVAGFVGSAIGVGILNAKRLKNLFDKNEVMPIVLLREQEQAQKPKAEKTENK